MRERGIERGDKKTKEREGKEEGGERGWRSSNCVEEVQVREVSNKERG